MFKLIKSFIFVILPPLLGCFSWIALLGVLTVYFKTVIDFHFPSVSITATKLAPFHGFSMYINYTTLRGGDVYEHSCLFIFAILLAVEDT